MRLAGSLDLEPARVSFIYLFFRNKSYENCLCWKARTGNWKRWVCGWLVGIKQDQTHTIGYCRRFWVCPDGNTRKHCPVILNNKHMAKMSHATLNRNGDVWSTANLTCIRNSLLGGLLLMDFGTIPASHTVCDSSCNRQLFKPTKFTIAESH